MWDKWEASWGDTRGGRAGAGAGGAWWEGAGAKGEGPWEGGGEQEGGEGSLFEDEKRFEGSYFEELEEGLWIGAFERG